MEEKAAQARVGLRHSRATGKQRHADALFIRSATHR